MFALWRKWCKASHLKYCVPWHTGILFRLLVPFDNIIKFVTWSNNIQIRHRIELNWGSFKFEIPVSLHNATFASFLGKFLWAKINDSISSIQGNVRKLWTTNLILIFLTCLNQLLNPLLSELTNPFKWVTNLF